MFKTKFNLYKTFLVFACLFFACSNSLLSNNNEDITTDIDVEEVIETVKKALSDKRPLLTSDEIDKICNADFYKQKAICDFLNKVIIEIPIEIPSSIVNDLLKLNIPRKTIDENPIRITLKLCNGDLVKIPIHAMDLYADYLLKRALKLFYEENAFKKIKNDTENFINALKKLDPISDKKIQKENECDFLRYINKEHSLSYGNVIKDIFLKKVFLYIVFAEFSLWIKEYFLGPREIHNFEQLKNNFFTNTTKIPFKMQEQEDGGQKIVFVPKISFTLYELLQIPYSSYLSHPLTTGTNYFTRLLDMCLDDRKCYETTDGKTKKRMFFKILDSSSFGLIKKFLMLAKTIKILDHSVYKKRWTSHLKNNRNEFVKLLNKYQEATKTLKSKENIQNIKLIEQEIKNFISKGHDVSYSFWLKYKNAAFASSEMKINLLFSIPSIFLIGKIIHEKYEDGTLTTGFEKIKNFIEDQPEFKGPEGKILLIALSVISTGVGSLLLLILFNLGSPTY